MTRLGVRLTRVEVDLRRQRPLTDSLAVLWHDELQPCQVHPRCCIETATGHHGLVIQLTFGAPHPEVDP